jgi:hypothetical protein
VNLTRAVLVEWLQFAAAVTALLLFVGYVLRKVTR